jgi:uncharacterized OsmC-like protein
MADLQFRVDGIADTQTRIQVKTRQFSLVIDEPPALGGDDAGANPVEYLLASYAGCLNVMAHLVAREMGINLSKLAVKVEGTLNPDRIFGKSFDERAGFKTINVVLTPESDASPDVLEKWLEVLESRCPVNDNLSNPTPLNVRIG